MTLESRQAFFDKAWSSIIKQGKASVTLVGPTGKTLIGKPLCVFRGPGGTKCAFGHFIEDDEYIPEMESYLLRESIYQPILDRLHVSVDFALSVQACHDGAAFGSTGPFYPELATDEDFIEGFKERMMGLARSAGLIIPDDQPEAS